MSTTEKQSFAPESPGLIFLVVALSVFVAEAFVTLLLHFLPKMPYVVEALMDATLLVAIMSPALYFFVFRPMDRRIREINRVEAILRKNREEQFKTMIHASPDGFWMTDLRGRFLDVNDSYCRMMGYSREELLGMGISDVEAVETPKDTARHIAELMRSGYLRFETRHRHKNGGIVDVEVSANYSTHTGEAIYGFLRDITERKRNETELAKFKAIVDSTDYAIISKSLDGVILSWNPGSERLFGYTAAEAIGRPVQMLVPPERMSEEPEIMARIARGEIVEHFETVRRCKDGRLIDISATISPVLDEEGRVIGASKIARDITREKRAEEKVNQLAYYDALTGLPNRSLFADRMRQAIAAARRDKACMAMMYIDLDKFKPVNDTFGHDVGDLLLKEVAMRLKNCMRESDTVSRVGGDEFLALLPVIEAELDAQLVAEKILYAISLPFEIAGHDISISASIGIASYPNHGGDEMTLTRNADTAMYYAKNGGRNNVRIYQPDMIAE